MWPNPADLVTFTKKKSLNENSIFEQWQKQSCMKENMNMRQNGYEIWDMGMRQNSGMKWAK